MEKPVRWLPSDGKPFRNPVREGLPTNRELNAAESSWVTRWVSVLTRPHCLPIYRSRKVKFGG